MVFNVMARNQDDHTKNISFLMDKSGKWKLSPAYDMSWAYNPAGEWTSQHQMSINNKWTNITLEDVLKVAASINIRRPKEIVEQITDVVAHWHEYAKPLGIPQKTVEDIGKTLIVL